MTDFAKLERVAEAFSPSAPIDREALFAGRIDQLVTVMNAIAQKGQHVVMYGERGVGKTSLASVITSISRGRGTLVATLNCDSTMTFGSMWLKTFREFVFTTTKPGPGFKQERHASVASVDTHLPDNPSPDDVRHVLVRLGRTVIVLDEIDRLTNARAKTLLADTIKALSDHAVPTTIILVGVADSVDMLLAEHRSIERALLQVPMPRMSRTELEEIVVKGMTAAGLVVASDAAKWIASLSQGLPHYTHLLALHAGQAAVMEDRDVVQIDDVTVAINKSLTNAQQTTISSYVKATVSPRENLYPQVLLACSMAETDDLGYFAAIDVRGPMSKIMKKAYEIPAFAQHLNSFCEESRGAVLQRTGTPRRYRFRFCNPLLQPYVLMRGLKDKTIEKEALH